MWLIEKISNFRILPDAPFLFIVVKGKVLQIVSKVKIIRLSDYQIQVLLNEYDAKRIIYADKKDI
jgi:hypothetical protein